MEQEKKIIGGWVVWLVILSIIVSSAFAISRYVGLYTGTFVNRKVFEQSYQKKAADQDSIDTYDAQLSILNRRLMRSDITLEDKNEIRAQIDAIIILKSSKGN